MKLVISPSSGPPGTTVTITVTGCIDPSGQNHAISFNNDYDNLAARNDPNTLRSIRDEQDGTSLAATYKIARGDATGGVGAFVVQCGEALRAANFKVTA